MEKWLRVGKIKGAHALKGELWVLLFGKSADWLPRLKRVGLGLGLKGPEEFHEVEFAKVHGEGLRIKLRGIPDRTAAELHLNQYFYISEDLLVSKKGEDIFLAEIQDFEVYDGEVLIGRIESFSSNGPQDLLCLGRGIEIPFVKEFIENIDFAAKCIRMKLPEGLLEINTEEADRSLSSASNLNKKVVKD